MGQSGVQFRGWCKIAGHFLPPCTALRVLAPAQRAPQDWAVSRTRDPRRRPGLEPARAKPRARRPARPNPKARPRAHTTYKRKDSTSQSSADSMATVAQVAHFRHPTSASGPSRRAGPSGEESARPAPTQRAWPHARGGARGRGAPVTQLYPLLGGEVRGSPGKSMWNQGFPGYQLRPRPEGPNTEVLRLGICRSEGQGQIKYRTAS